MFDLLLILLIIPLAGCLFTLTARKNSANAFRVALFTMGTGIFTILRLFATLKMQSEPPHLQYIINWFAKADVNLLLSVDYFSLLLLLGTYVALVIGLVGLSAEMRRQKSLFVLFLYFVWHITGLLLAGDMILFYIFFAGMLIPLFMLIGHDQIKKKSTLYTFFLFNFGGVLLLLIAILIAYKYYSGNLQLHEFVLMKMPKSTNRIVWSGVCLALVSRIPIWPFHYWLSTLGANIKNPLVYIITNLLPLTGLYGFMRFWQLSIAKSILPYMPAVVAVCLVTMFVIALIGIAHKEFLYKLFTYMTIFYLLFLLAEILLSSVLLAGTVQMNIAYSLFIFLIVTSSLVVLDMRMERECAEKKCDYRGALAYMPKRARIFAFFTLVALGLPISAMFWNNFIIISSLFRFSFLIGVMVMTAIGLISVSMLYELYVMRDLKSHIDNEREITDISRESLLFFTVVIVVIILSFFNPLWFVV